jgi:serine/threonine protein kinase/tetratricopeptide (TPR) repeat protein
LPKEENVRRVARFEAFVLDPNTTELCRDGERPMQLSVQPLRILVMLLSRPGDLVTREEIRSALWPNGTVVEFEHSISAAMNRLRLALGDSAESPRFIETIARRGYRWKTQVQWVEAQRKNAGGAEPEVEARRLSGAEGNLIGKKVSHYRVLAVLGGGGMGVVYKAEDLKLGRRVALKFLPEELVSDPAALKRFESEARAASALNHANICTIYEVEEHEGQPFLVMELLEGQTLRDLIATMASAKPALELATLLDLAAQITAGLEAAHRHGIIHRDIKPANIFITDQGQAKILDFGLAKLSFAATVAADSPSTDHREDGGSHEPKHEPESLTTSSPFLSRTGVAMGTAGYMSPEQIRGEKLDARTDLFSFGLVLYEVATGQRPFMGDTAQALHNSILNDALTPARELNPDLPLQLEAIINKSLEKNRDVRYRNAADIRTDLQRIKRDTESVRLPVATSAVAGTGRKLALGWKVFAPSAMLAAALASGSYVYFHPTPKLTDKDTLVLGDFTNTTGDAIFDDTLKTALSVSLRQSPFLNVLSDSQVAKNLQLMTRPASTKLTPEVARELCLRADSKAYLTGSIGSLGSEYLLGLKAVNCRSGDSLAEELATAVSKEKVLNVLGRAASKLRRELGESLATVEKYDAPLEQVTTSSLEALKAYSVGMKTYKEKGPAPALAYYQRAIELDPNFAMGYSAVGGDYASLDEVGRASEYFTKAFRMREHASEREKLAITAHFYANVTGELGRAAQTFREEIESYPREANAYVNLALVYASQGEYEKAAEIDSQAIRLAPALDNALANLAHYSLALQHFAEARLIIREAQAKRIDDFYFHNVLYALAFLSADSAAMSEQQQWYADRSQFENWGLALASDTEGYSGHLGKARELTRRAVDSAIRADNKENGAIFQAIAAQREAAYGNATEARQKAAMALKLAPASLGPESEATLAFAMAGDTTRAESLAQDLGKRFPLDTQMQSLWLPLIQTQLTLDRKNSASALNASQAASPIELGQIWYVINISCLYPAYVRGNAYLATGQGSAAAAEFQRILDHSGIVWNCWTGALAHLGVARGLAMQGNTAKAKTAYQDFFLLWKDADPDIPILIAAKAEYAKLH